MGRSAREVLLAQDPRGHAFCDFRLRLLTKIVFVVCSVQGALIEDHELQRLVDFVCEESAPSFSQELVQAATGAARSDSAGGGGADDELWDEAVRVILKSRRGSASLLQRALGIGYTRASRLIDLMTAEGVVGAHKGSTVFG